MRTPVLYLVRQCRKESPGLPSGTVIRKCQTLRSNILTATNTPRRDAVTASHLRKTLEKVPLKKRPRAFEDGQQGRYHTQTAASTTSPAAPITSEYKPPVTGLISFLPRSWQPFAELARLDKPTGTYYLFFPCLFSTLMAASYTQAPALHVASTSCLFLLGALVMRGAGCTINDLWDRSLDPHVQRTRLRPIARGAISPSQAIGFAGAQLMMGLGVLLQLPTSCLWYGIPSLMLVATYPLAKRITHYPQLVLGFTFSWGAIMGFPALSVDLLSDLTALKGVAALYASCISWTVLYDTIYAHMDIKDDAKVGIKSIALRHAADTKSILTGLAVTQVALLATAGSVLGATPLFYTGSCGGVSAALGIMIWRIKLQEVSNCWWWFKNGAWFTGASITAGLLADYLLATSDVEVTTKDVSRVQKLDAT